MSTVKNGMNVSVHYKGTLDDGTEFDSSYDRGETLDFLVGSGQMISGFDSGVIGMQIGETKTISINPGDAYGEVNPEAVQEIPKDQFPDDFEFIVGATVTGQGPRGPIIAKILKEGNDAVELDFNHPLAGQTLTFEIEVINAAEE